MRLATLDEALLRDFTRESNRIEGITREPYDHEVTALRRFDPTVGGLTSYVQALDPTIELRELPRMDVRVGDYYPPRGGPAIREMLEALLGDARAGDPYLVHREYESLHPFTDGNGRSGRALWLWMMLKNRPNGLRAVAIGFLHRWYYQSLAAER